MAFLTYILLRVKYVHVQLKYLHLITIASKYGGWAKEVGVRAELRGTLVRVFPCES